MLSWFLTRNGRIFTHTTVGIVTATVFSAHVAIHGPLLNKYQEIIQLYNKGRPKPLSPEILSRSEKVLSQCDIDGKEKFKFFPVVGHEIQHAGGRNSPWGAIIGIPFTFEKREDIDTSRLMLIGNDEIDWFFEGEDLLSTLLLSEKAQKFAIAREIYASDINLVYQNAAIAAFFVFLPANLSRKINIKRNAYNFPLRSRILCYSVCYVLAFFMYYGLKDPLKYFFDKDCDAKAAEIGKEYLEGGIEFYEKTLGKHKALREFMGSRGKSLYLENGDENYLLFTPKLPITKRLEFLKKMKMSPNKTEIS